MNKSNFDIFVGGTSGIFKGNFTLNIIGYIYNLY